MSVYPNDSADVVSSTSSGPVSTLPDNNNDDKDNDTLESTVSVPNMDMQMFMNDVQKPEMSLSNQTKASIFDGLMPESKHSNKQSISYSTVPLEVLINTPDDVFDQIYGTNGAEYLKALKNIRINAKIYQDSGADLTQFQSSQKIKDLQRNNQGRGVYHSLIEVKQGLVYIGGMVDAEIRTVDEGLLFVMMRRVTMTVVICTLLICGIITIDMYHCTTIDGCEYNSEFKTQTSHFASMHKLFGEKFTVTDAAETLVRKGVERVGWNVLTKVASLFAGFSE